LADSGSGFNRALCALSMVGSMAFELRELKLLREENRKPKGLVVDLTLDKQILWESLKKKI
jgi:hypothetical protein